MAVNVDIRANIETDFKSGKIDKATYEFEKAALNLKQAYKYLYNLSQNTTDLGKLDKAVSKVNELEGKFLSLKNTVNKDLFKGAYDELSKLDTASLYFGKIKAGYESLQTTAKTGAVLPDGIKTATSELEGLINRYKSFAQILNTYSPGSVSKGQFAELNAMVKTLPEIEKTYIRTIPLSNMMSQSIKQSATSDAEFNKNLAEGYKLYTNTTKAAVDQSNANAHAFDVNKLNGFRNELNVLTNSFNSLVEKTNDSATKTSTLVGEYRALGSQISDLQNRVSSQSSILPPSLQQDISALQGQYNQLGQQLQSNIADRLKSGFKELGSIAKKSFNDVYNISKTVITKSASYLKSAFTSVLNGIGEKFKSIFSSSSSSGVAQQLRSLILGAGVAKGFKTAIGLSSELTEAQNRLQYVFGESANAVTEFARTSARDFGLTENSATKFSATFGGILSASGIASNELASFSENLTKMTGDLASFYDVDQDVFFKKLQAGLAGNAAALRTYGINVSATNLELYRMSKGIQTAYKDMDQASRITLRYNYIVESASQAQGDFARTQFTWANQIRLLKSQFMSLASIVGGYFVKTLLPVVRILNQIVGAAINAFTALASLFGFDSDSIKALTGGAKGTIFDDSAAGYIDDTADALGNESKALDKTGKAAKEAADNLQGFDKLNNISSSSGSGAGGGAGGGASGVGAGIKPLDWASLTKAPDIEKTPLEKWFDEFFNLLKDKKWNEAGKSLAKQLNNITDTIYDKLTDPKLKTGIHNFNDALTDFYDGLLDYDTKKLGQTFGAGINLIAYSINDLYEQAVKKDLLSKTGAKISDFFYGLATETKWEEVGKAFVTGFRSAMDILAGFIEKAKEQDLGNEIGTAIKDFIDGAVERLFGNGGAEEIGNNIAGLLNLAFDVIASSIGNEDTLDSIASGVVTTINTAIQGIDSSKLSKAVSAILNLFATIFHTIGDIDTDTLSTDIADAINGAVDDGSVENLASGITSAITNIFNLIGETISKINRLDLGISIIKGISDGLSSTEGEGYLIKAFGLLFGVRLRSNIPRLGIGLLGSSIVSSLASSLLGGAPTIIGTGGLGGVFTVANAAKFGLKGAILAMAISLGKTLVDGVKDGLDQTVATEDILDGMREDLKGTITLSVDPSAYSNLQEYRDKLKQLQGTYDNISTLVDDISFGEDTKTSIEDLTEYLNRLEKAGAGGSTQFKNLKKAIDDYNNAEFEDKSAAFDNVYSLAQDLSLEFESTVDTIDSLNDIQFNALDENFSKLKQNTKFSADEVNELTLTWSNAGEQLSKNLLDKVNETVGSDTTVDTSVANLVSDATSDANTGATEKGSGVATNLTTGVSAALFADSTVDNATSSLVTDATSETNVSAKTKGSTVGSNLTAGVASILNADTSVDTATSSLVSDATSDSNTLAKSKGAGVASNITSGATSLLATDTSLQTSEANLVARATADENTNAFAKGLAVGGSLTSSMSSALNTDTSTMEAMISLVSKSTAENTIKAYEAGKSAGANVIDGINAGISDDKKQAGVFTGIRSFANNVITNFKDALGIHSPSRVFKSLASFIPEGVALGVESNAKVATNAIGNMCSSLSGEFENSQLDANSLIPVGKFDGMYDSLMRQTDMAFDYVASKFDNLREMINLQSSLVVNPSVGRANLEAAYASASDVSGVVRSVGNIYSKLATGNIGSSNKPIQVNVYLDKNNKLSSYIINTVNGNATKTGNF
jgi:hypothetical protein|uniref:Minor tail protein n=1 Tax=Siphoviridae sp. ctoSr5 TaxID=2826460 RepID=A0A8S5MV66_9CAUD|nr:MAG TPA: minor tail protein [Siphoviridae sp. ctoSr5]